MFGFGGLGARAHTSSPLFSSSSSTRHSKRLRRDTAPIPPPTAPPPPMRIAARVTLLTAAAAFSGLGGQCAAANAAANPRGVCRAGTASAASSAAAAAASASGGDDGGPSAIPRWSVRRTLGDGSCLFRAVVQGASLADSGEELAPDDEERAARALRMQTVQALRDHRDDIEPFLPGIAPDFARYCALMERPSTWGGEPELAMAAQHVLRRPLAVYSARLGDRIARESAAARAGAGGAEGAAGLSSLDDGLPPPVVTYGEDFLDDPMAPHVVRLLWSGNHYETLVDEHRARRLRASKAAGSDGDDSDGSAGSVPPRSRL